MAKLTALRAAGARITYAGPAGFLPLDVEGGTLREWIDSRKLYAGGRDDDAGIGVGPLVN